MSNARPLRDALDDALLRELGLRRGDAIHEPDGCCATGLPELDRLLEGGFPLGCLSEIAGPASSGRTSLALGALAQATGRGELVAVVDPSDAFDPISAAQAGVDLERVLWVRAPAWTEALRSCERLLQTEGFPLVVLDGSRPAAPGRPHPAGSTSAWLRLSRLATGTRTALLLLSQERLSGSRAGVALELEPARPRFTGTPALLEAIEARAVLVRHRAARSAEPVRLRLPPPSPSTRPPSPSTRPTPHDDEPAP